MVLLPSPRLLNWLVSGNHGATIEFTPALGLNLNAGTLKYPLGNDEEAVLLVGAGSAGSEATSATSVSPWYTAAYSPSVICSTATWA